MTRINTNVNSMLAQRIMGQNENSLSTSLQRLSTGLKINSGKDDPAGLIASENLKSQETSLNAAIGNANRADQVMNIAEGGLQQVNSLLLQLQGLVGQSANTAGLSDQEKAANQMQVDSILQTIDRLASSTSFQGTKLLNGTFDFAMSGQSADIEGAHVNAAKLGHNQQRDVQIVVTASAQNAGLVMDMFNANSGGTLTNSGTTSLNFAGSGVAKPDDRLIFDVAGAKGSREFTFASGTALSTIADQINTFTTITGVSAVATSSVGTYGLVLKSTEMGSGQFVSIDMVSTGGQRGRILNLSASQATAIASGLSGTTLSAATNPIRDTGQDLGAIINGIAATATGRKASINTDFLNVEMTLGVSGAQHLHTIDAFTITGGGAKFNLGPNVDIENQVSIGLGNVSTRNLGSLQHGFLDDLSSSQGSNLVNGNLATAQEIVNDAINQVSTLRGRIGAFQKNVIGSTISSLGITLENTTAAESQITDTDFASATANMTRNQILVQASTQVLKIANSQPQAVLSLLQQ